jgi:hypothetical protein
MRSPASSLLSLDLKGRLPQILMGPFFDPQIELMIDIFNSIFANLGQYDVWSIRIGFLFAYGS